MQFPENFKNSINFINTLDPSEDSLGFSNQELVRRNYSCIRNFFRWCIYFITCKSRPLNEELDKASSYFAKEVKKIENRQMTQEEITSLKRAIETLETIISKNGGSKGEKIKKLIAIVNKIEASDAVNGLKNNNKEDPQQVAPKKPQEKVIPNIIPPVNLEEPAQNKKIKEIIPHDPVVKPKDERLQKLLQDLIEKKPDYDLIANEVGNILPTLEESVDLSEQEIGILSIGLARLTFEWIDKNAKKLHPNILRFITTKTFENKRNSLGFFPRLFKSLTTEPIDKEKLASFVRGIPLLDGDRKPHLVPVLKELLHNFTPEFIPILKNNLSQEDLTYFIENVFGKVATVESFRLDFHDAIFREAVKLMDSFGPEYRQTILRSLCQSKEAHALTHILYSTKLEENILQNILAQEIEDKENKFFSTFCELQFLSLFKEKEQQYLPYIIDYIFKHENDVRKKILFDKIPWHFKVSYIENIPDEFLKDHIKVFFYQARGYEDKDVGKKALKHLTQLVEKEEFFEFKAIDLYITQLASFGEKFQEQILSKVLELIKSPFNLNEQGPIGIERFLEKAKELPINRWEEASRELENVDEMETIFTLLQPAQRAAFIRGQKNNEDFLFKFFGFVFKDVQHIKDRIQYFEPELFKMNDLNKISKETWILFYKILDENRQDEKIQKLLIASTIHLFKEDHGFRSEIFFALSKEQIEFLPIEKYPHEISLLLACETDKLNHPSLKDIVSNFNEKEGQEFLKLFRSLYKPPIDLIELTKRLGRLNAAPHLRDACIEAIFTASNVNENALYYLIHFARNAKPKDLCNELPSMNDGQIFVAALHRPTNMNIKNALVYARENNLIPETIAHVESILNEVKDEYHIGKPI